ncbi:response regulator [Rahnella inusitata]|uniref:response regulator n=1 Tax=Rahnella inusitata TaxID=58169 RepID=UPI0039BDE166
MKLLIIEDNEYKSEKIRNFLIEHDKDYYITVTHSYSSAIKSFGEHTFDFAIIDMSLPTFDRVAGEPPGEFRTFGGLDIAKQIHRKKMHLKYIFLTQYDSFADDDKNYSLENIENLAKEKYPINFLGCIYYDNSNVAWKNKILSILREI